MNKLDLAGGDRIELMQTFIRIVETGSLSAAAAQLGMTQPTVSRRLQALERSLGLKLLQRSTHAMKLTEDGERCFVQAGALLESWHAMEADLRDMTSDILRSALAAAEVAQRDGEDAMAAATAVAAAGLAALGMVRAVWPAAADANPQAGT